MIILVKVFHTNNVLKNESIVVLIVSLFVICLPILSAAQQQRETHFFGSFILKDQVFNYEYWLTPNQISSLKIEKITTSPAPDASAIAENLQLIGKKINEKAEQWHLAALFGPSVTTNEKD